LKIDTQGPASRLRENLNKVIEFGRGNSISNNDDQTNIVSGTPGLQNSALTNNKY